MRGPIEPRYLVSKLAFLESKYLVSEPPATAMTHIAIQEKLDGKVVDWMEQVSDEQYQGVT